MKFKTSYSSVACAITAGLLAAAAVPASASSVRLSYGATAGVIGSVAVAPLSTPNQFVTAVQNSVGDLEAIAWFNNTATSQVQRLGTFTAGGIQSFGLLPALGVAGISNNRFVTAVINSGGFLELIVCTVEPAGNITRQGSVTVGVAISALAVTALDGEHVVTVTTNFDVGDTITETAAIWAVDSNGNITSAEPSWSIDNPGAWVAVAAMDSSQVIVAQSYIEGSPFGPFYMTSWVVTPSVYGQEALYNTVYNLSFQMVSLGNGNFAIASAPNRLVVALWSFSSIGVMSQTWANSSLPIESALGLANVGGLPFTLSDSSPFVSGTAMLEANVWYGSQPIATAVDEAIVCSDDSPCLAAAAGLSATQVATATASFGGDLHVDIWTFAQ